MVNNEVSQTKKEKAIGFLFFALRQLHFIYH